jgi:hypothetical protein
MTEQVITLTTADPIQTLAVDGPHKIDIAGTFGGGTVTAFSYTTEAGKGAQLQLDGSPYSATATDYYRSECPYTQFELTGSTGADVKIIATPITSTVRNA